MLWHMTMDAGPPTGGWGPFSLEGRHAVVTGAAMGIGLGIVRRFVEAGADVLAVDRDGAALELATGQLPGHPGRIVTLAADVAADDAPQVMVQRAVEAFGSVDILVNNAGIFPMTPALEMSPALLDHVLRVNLRGLVLASTEVARHMVEQGGGGAIVNISSIDAFHPAMVGLAAYDTSKGGVLMFTRSLALELARHRIRVNGVAPGGITTPGTTRPLEGSGLTPQQAQEQREQFIRAKVPLGRMGEPDDIALATVFLASPAAAYMTGQTIIVDGGTLLT
jgi:2-dehydro-3-deoxy-D-gluconate 5-dehydrogenase